MVKEITITDALQMEGVCFVDVRSEGEFAEGSIPGAVNVPLFTNEERAKIGTTYKQVGPEEAKRLGLEFASPKLPGLFNKIADIAKEKKVFLYCWRGGMRSKYTASILNALGLPVYRIQGGYKAYRRFVHRYLDRETIPHKSIVLHGLTGVGKTIVLQKLQERLLPVLDLETIARHRGSAYGKIGLPDSPSQKDFEAQIVQALVAAEDQGVIIVECESRRLGKLIVPPAVMNSMVRGYRVLLYASLQTRVERILREYTDGSDHNIERLQFSTSLLKKSLGAKVVEDLNRKIAEKRFTEVIPYLLTHYYDPLYKYPDRPSEDYDLSVDCEDLDSAVNQLAQWVTTRPEYGVPVENGGESYANRGSLEECEDQEGVFF
ncbi:tRNA 2-selenouridine synthase [Desulforamulus putei DSM 12395]|uniref:tRNA 2-selenouridine synthase n=1 Tax=Desulforamulus putei DSM 12395 TaxID=1121429 RepID=A0A1M4TDR1_9FIRM|nr:tRNA 2-selenouridine(34) synthase MnmH [Desulforamulus putei]SHE42515.1 tRNA 2-selenouridine synthase [Desulforamulus putei DSM 12395]